MDSDTLVEFHEWGPEPFEIARETDTPLLVVLSPPWCDRCETMASETFDSPMIAANVNDDFVPVLVDPDRRPRIRDRYTMGGFPTVVFLSPSGAILTGSTYMDANTFRNVIERVRDSYEDGQTGSVPRPLQGGQPPAGALSERIERHMTEQLHGAFDTEHAGWGTGAKFPLPRTIEFALKRAREPATRTLDAVSRGLIDEYDGSAYRYANEPSWGDPHRAKLLSTNGALCGAYATAYQYTGEERYRRSAERLIEFLATTLWTGSAFAGSQAASDYYTRSATDRESTESPPVDATVFADGNAIAIRACARYYALTDDESAKRFGERALDHITTTLLDADGRVQHFAGGPAGLLTDQASLLRALTTVAQTIDPAVRETATSVADWTIDGLRSSDGRFVDGPIEGPGLLDRPLYPLDSNTTLANALVDLSVLTETDRYAEIARESLAQFAGASDRMGAEVAHYATAVERARSTPLTITVADEPGSDLHRAALRIADHEKIVVLTGDHDGWAAVTTGETASDRVRTPEALISRVQGE